MENLRNRGQHMAYETHRRCVESSQMSTSYHPVKEQQAARLTTRNVSLSLKSWVRKSKARHWAINLSC